MGVENTTESTIWMPSSNGGDAPWNAAVGRVLLATIW